MAYPETTLENDQATTSGGGTVTVRRIHASLYRPTLFAGVEQSVAVIEGTIAAALLFGVGLHFATIILVAIILGIIHPIMVWAAKYDPRITDIFIRSLTGRDYYPAHSRHDSPPARVHTSIPRAR